MIARLEQMLTTGLIRLVTLTGPGGIGKTRIACEVASRLRDRFATVRFIDLTAERDPAAVLPGIMAALATSADETPADVLRQRVLLVLDNFEHLLDAASDLGALLRDHPGVAAIVTSRAVLGLRWEHPVAVPPLALDVPAGQLEREPWRSPAVDLFIEALRRHQPEFMPTPESQLLIAEICAALEGVPLALELAAARAKLLSLADLRERLREPLDVLRAGGRDLPLRQQALRNSIEWSSQLLTPVELATARQLAVLAGGGTLEIADAVVRFPDEQSSEWLLDALVGLVDKSILSIDVRHDPAPRFRMLASVRSWFYEQLALTGMLADTEQRYVDWVVSAAARYADQAVTEPSEAFDALEREWDNLTAVFEWQLAHGEIEAAERLALLLGPFWCAGVYAIEGREWLDRLLALEVARGAARSCELWLARARLALRGADPERLSDALERIAELQRDEPGAGHEATTAHLWTVFARRSGQLELAEQRLREARALVAPVDERAFECQLLLVESGIAIDRHDLARALRAARAAAKFARERGLFEQQALATIQIAGVELLLGQVDSADATLSQAHTLATQARSRSALILARVGLGAVAAERGHVALALRHYREALAGGRPGDALDATLAALDALRSLALQPDAPGVPRALANLDELRALERYRWVSPLPWLAHLAREDDLEDDDHTRDALESLPAAIERAVRAMHGIGGTEVPEPVPAVIFVVPEGMEDLSLRERQVVRCVAQGMTNRQIADELGIADRTVDSHVGNVLRKLKLRTRSGIAAWAVQHGMHSPGDAASGSVRTSAFTDRTLRKG